MAAPVYQSFAEGKTGFGSSVTVANPSGLSDGDLMVYCGLVVGGSGHLDPTGWTQSHLTANGSGYLWMGYKIASSEPASWNWSWTGFNSSYMSVIRITGHDSTTPIDITSTPGTGTSAAPICPDETTVTNEDLVLACMIHQNNTNVDTGNPSGTTIITCDNYGGSGTAGASYFEQTVAGATGTKTWSASGSGQWVAVNFCIRSANPAGGIPVFQHHRQQQGASQ